jgi:hypothetical protein
MICINLRMMNVDGRFGSQAVVQHVTTQTSAFERLADVQIKSRSKARIERLLSLIAVIQIAENQAKRRAAFGQKQTTPKQVRLPQKSRPHLELLPKRLWSPQKYVGRSQHPDCHLGTRELHHERFPCIRRKVWSRTCCKTVSQNLVRQYRTLASLRQ